MASIEGKIESFAQTPQRTENCERSVTELQEEIASLKEAMDVVENHSRRNYLIVYGVSENETETTNSLREAVLTEIFEQKLGIKVNSHERINLLGKKGEQDSACHCTTV